MATRRGFEPRLEGPKPTVLPLHYRVMSSFNANIPTTPGTVNERRALRHLRCSCFFSLGAGERFGWKDAGRRSGALSVKIGSSGTALGHFRAVGTECPSPPSVIRCFLAAFYAARTKLRSLSRCFSLTRPKAMASMTTRAKSIRKRILAIPRMKWFSNPKLTSSRPLTRSTAVRFL